MKALAWLQVGAYLAVFAALAFGFVMVSRWFRSIDALRASPLGIPARAIDSGIEGLTGGAKSGGEDTLGGVFARAREWITGDSAAIDAMKKGAQLPAPSAYSVNPRLRT